MPALVVFSSILPSCLAFCFRKAVGLKNLVFWLLDLNLLPSLAWSCRLSHSCWGCTGVCSGRETPEQEHPHPTALPQTPQHPPCGGFAPTVNQQSRIPACSLPWRWICGVGRCLPWSRLTPGCSGGPALAPCPGRRCLRALTWQPPSLGRVSWHLPGDAVSKGWSLNSVIKSS